jgi:hypothetical protein
LDSCGHRNEPYSFIRGEIFLDKLSEFGISGVVLVDGLGGGPINFDSRDPRSVPSPERLLRPYILFGRLQWLGLADFGLHSQGSGFKARHTGWVALFICFFLTQRE